MQHKLVEDNFYRDGAKLFTETVNELLKDHPELAKPFPPGSIEEQEQQKIQQRFADLSKQAEVEAYYLDMSNLSDTEKKLANIWKEVLILSEKECRSLNRKSNFLDLVESFCATIEIARLENEICSNFEIDKNEIGKLEPDSTLQEQAAWIDCHLHS